MLQQRQDQLWATGMRVQPVLGGLCLCLRVDTARECPRILHWLASASSVLGRLGGQSGRAGGSGQSHFQFCAVVRAGAKHVDAVHWARAQRTRCAAGTLVNDHRMTILLGRAKIASTGSLKYICVQIPITSAYANLGDRSWRFSSPCFGVQRPALPHPAVASGC